MANAKRVGDIDFWRGAVLVAILVDHIPGNLLESFTPRNFGLSDSSEAFVFMSGLSVGLIYAPRARARGLATVARGCLQRALKLYGAHIVLTLSALAIFACAFWISGVNELIQAHGRSYVFDSPAVGLAGLALLSHQLGYFNILPLYIVLMLWAPLALALAMRDVRLALAVSVAQRSRHLRRRLGHQRPRAGRARPRDLIRPEGLRNSPGSRTRSRESPPCSLLPAGSSAEARPPHPRSSWLSPEPLSRYRRRRWRVPFCSCPVCPGR